MVKSFAFDSTNDLYLDTSSNLAIAQDIEAVKFACQNAIQTILGEMIYQTNQGVPYFQIVWKGNPNLLQFKAALTATLLTVANVKEVVTIEFSRDGNRLNFVCTILTIFGIVPVESGVPLVGLK